MNMHVQRGSSGAIVYPLSHDRVYKMHTNDPRLSQQAQWLIEHESPATPKVYSCGDSSYEMEMLFHPTVFLDHQIVLNAMITTLEKHVWSQDAVVSFDKRALDLKLHNLFQNENITSPLGLIAKEIDWDELPVCLTHGDPTFDNVMFRDTDELVFIDPLPATPAIPDMRAVDYGKILQSCLGYEHVRYQNTNNMFRATWYMLKPYIKDENEWRATVFWAVVHLLRCLPYNDEFNIRSGLGKLISDATSLVRS